jgi:outer membrane receptor for ferrienterochelin and colicin
MNKSTVFALLLCTMVLFAARGLAGDTGKISGTVTDKVTGEAIPGVNVRVDGSQLGASTDIDGRYVILNVPPGKRSVIASFVGYKRLKVENIQVNVDFTSVVDLKLEQGDIQLDAIVVQGERTPLVRPDLTNPVASIGAETINELPVTSIDEIIGLQSGVVLGDNGVIHVRGGLGNEIVYTLNGINLNNPYGNTRSVGLATNAVQEVSLSTGTFAAEYGSALSGVVNYVTKEGGSRWTGSLRHLTGNYFTDNNLFPDLPHTFKDFYTTIPNIYRTEVSLGGPILGDVLSFYGSAVYDFFGGRYFGQRLYQPTDSYLPRGSFPSGDPRGGSSADPYYFGPVIHPTTDLNGGPQLSGKRGYGDVVPLDKNVSYNFQGNLTFKITPSMKLKYETVYEHDEGYSTTERAATDAQGAGSGLIQSKFKPDGRALEISRSVVHSLDFTHTVNDKMFYTVKASYIFDQATSRAYESPYDPRYLPAFYQQTFPNTSYLTGGTDNRRFYRKTETVAGKFDLVAQWFTNHEIKFGVEARIHRLEVEQYTLQFQDPNHPGDEPSFSNMLLNGDVFKPYIPDIVGGYTYYVRKPLQLAAYAQDKIELFKSIILNLGLRAEYFDPKANYNPDISDELLSGDPVFVDQHLTRASKKTMLSPRFSVSYPITDQGTIRFSYGHFYQIGSLSSLYLNPDFRSPRGTPVFGNPDVNPQKSVQYELGLQQGLTEDMKIEITGYYKDVSNYIYSQLVITPRGDRQYNLLTNLNYANTRGVSISLVKRRSPGDIFAATIDYTFQIADGNRTEPTDEIFFSQQEGKLSETYLVPFDFDRSHTVTTTVNLSQPEDWSISMIGYFRTGTPYTPAFPTDIVPITFVQNSDRKSVQWNVDLKVEKIIPTKPVSFSIYLQVDNLFDTQNELTVYGSTGRALTNISSISFFDLESRIQRGDPGMIPLSAVQNYYARPQNVSAPRLVRIGASVLF